MQSMYSVVQAAWAEQESVYLTNLVWLGISKIKKNKLFAFL